MAESKQIVLLPEGESGAEEPARLRAERRALRQHREAFVETRDDDAAKRHLLANLMDHTTDPIYFKDRESRFTLISQELAKRFGLASPDAAIGKTDFDFFSEEHARQAFEDEQNILRTGKPLINEFEKETWPDGHVTWVSTTKLPLLDEQGCTTGTFGISRDITDLKLAQDELQRTQERLEELVEERTKALSEANHHLQREIADRQRAENALIEGERLAAIRLMAGGVAMNFNMIVGIISAYASSIASNFLPTTRVHDEATRILEATERAGALTRRLMDMAKTAAPKSDKASDVIPIARVCRQAIELVDEMLREKQIETCIEYAETPVFVRGDRGRLLDTIMAFLINAAEAMPEGGQIRIEITERKVSRPGTRNPDAVGGLFAILRIRDTGIGISRESIPHIFEPFFTTKNGHVSFGLGLPTAQSTVQGMGGWISCRSRVGKGTTFQLFFPKADVSGEKLDEPPAVNGDREFTVLIVDDEADILKMMQLTLESAGYHVLAATDLRSASTALSNGRGPVDLSIIDATIRGSDALDIVKRIRKRDPQASIILTSGFSRDYIRGVVPLGTWGFLQKPFDPQQLVDGVRDALKRQAEVAAG